MNNDNYLVIQGWMRNELNIKGNELMVYALIYGFSQDNESEFNGSANYIADWIGSSRQTVHNVLKSLCDKGLLHKREENRNGVKFCSYKALHPVKKFDRGVSKNLTGGCQKILHNNIDNNTNKKYIEYIVEYLNKKAGTHYRPTTDATVKVITARLNERFTVDDFKTVIDKKVAQWKGTSMEEFLRPQTLFGSKFESYLNQNIIKQEKPVKTANFIPEPPKYREFEPEPEIETSQMPESMREKYRGFINEL